MGGGKLGRFYLLAFLLIQAGGKADEQKELGLTGEFGFPFNFCRYYYDIIKKN